MQKEVFKGELLYISDKDFVHDLARKTYQEYDDFKPRRNRIIRGKMEKTDVRWKEYLEKLEDAENSEV